MSNNTGECGCDNYLLVDGVMVDHHHPLPSECSNFSQVSSDGKFCSVMVDIGDITNHAGSEGLRMVNNNQNY